MKALTIIGVWSVLTTAVMYIMFAPDQGLVNQGPLACAGLAIIGLAIVRYRQQEEDTA